MDFSLLHVADVDDQAEKEGGDEGEDAGDAAELREDAVGAGFADFEAGV